MTKFDRGHGSWHGVQPLRTLSYTCGFCDNRVGSFMGLPLMSQSGGNGVQIGGVYLCPHCQAPTMFDVQGEQIPAPMLGNPVQHAPPHLLGLYNEARRCTAAGANTAAVLLLRKMLMNTAVDHGAKAGDSFASYVSFLEEQGIVPKKARPWIDKIRRSGNEATHEVAPKSPDEAKQLLSFVEMILKTNYEFLHGLGSLEDSTDAG